jgi:hypothetical protein
MDDVVRDMYEGVDLNILTIRQRGSHRRKQLRENVDVLFRIYRTVNNATNVHVLLCRPRKQPERMTRILRTYINDTNLHVSLQLTSRIESGTRRVETISMSGKKDQLEDLCEAFPTLLTDMGIGPARYKSLFFEFMFDLLNFYIPRLMSHYNGLA